MNISRAVFLSGPLLVALATASPALAAKPADQAAAEVLFTDARKLAEAGDFAHACPKFAESQRLDPTAGGGLSAGDCFERLGKLASAWGAFKEAEIIARDAGDTGRQGEAARRAVALSAKLAKLTIIVSPGARVPGLELRRDGAVVGEGQWGSAMPVDQGEHTVEVSAPGRKTWSKVVRVDADGASASVDVPELAAGSAEPTPPPARGSNTQRTVGFVLGGAGLAGLVVGGVLGGLALKNASNSKANGHCDADLATCDATGLQLQHDARTMAHGSTAAFVIGGAALAAGVVLVATAPKGSAAPDSKVGLRVTVGPTVGAAMRGVLLSGRW